MPKSLVQVTVNFATDPPTPNPNPVPVSRANNSGINWVANQDGYTFTGVTIDDVAAPTGDFGRPDISTNNAGRSEMSVTDSGDAVTTDHTYSLVYTDPPGNTRTFDPTIRNEP